VEHCHGILVRKSRWSETSILATWLTDRFGAVRTSARGALRQGGAFCGKLDLFHRAEITFSISRRSTLHTLREVNLLASLDNPSYATLSLASYFSDLALGIAPAMQPSHEIHDLLVRALDHLGSAPPSSRAFNHFERETARIAGVLDPRSDPATRHALAHLCGGFPKTRAQALKALTRSEPRP
jgi:DNA repair protein RecO (recombination protein O)